jgi:hypothetical protein
MKYILAHATARQRAHAAIDAAPDGWYCEIKEPSRGLAQNAALWAALNDIAKQTTWHGIKLSADEFKDLLSAGLVKSRVVPNMDGTGFVILGQRTSKMSKAMFSELLELVMAFGAERNVVWSEHEIAPPEGYR